MADEDVTAEVDQTPADGPQIEEAEPEAVVETAEVVADDVEVPEAEVVLDDPVEAIVEEDTEPVVAELSREEILERYADVIADERHKARQAREAELRRESATREATRQRVAELKKKLAEAPDDDLDSLNFVYDNAAGNARVELMREIAKQAADAWAPDEAQRESLFAAIDATGPEAIEQYASNMVGIAAKSLGQQSAFALSAEDIPADSPLAQSFAAREKSRIAAAVKAAKLEAQPAREPAPEAGVGQPVGPTDGNPLLLKLEREGRAALTPAERAQAAELLGVPVPD